MIHIVKLCVGANSIDDLAAWAATRIESNLRSGRGRVSDHVTRMFPKRRGELLAGGSLYWVIKGAVLVRQRMLDLQVHRGDDAIPRCLILLDPALVPTQAQSRKAFQGWRYLACDEAPPDLRGKTGASAPPSLRAELVALGLL